MHLFGVRLGPIGPMWSVAGWGRQGGATRGLE